MVPSLKLALMLLMLTIDATSAAPPYAFNRCGNESRTLVEIAAGREIRQRIILTPLPMFRCAWVLESPGDFAYVTGDKKNVDDTASQSQVFLTQRDDWGQCSLVSVHTSRTSGGGSWSQTVLPWSPDVLDPRLKGKCHHHRGVDCRQYLVSARDSTYPCPYDALGGPVCPEVPRSVTKLLAGRLVSGEWIQLDVDLGNASSCQWVLSGSWHGGWTRVDDCTLCTPSVAADTGSCLPPIEPDLVNTGCRNRLGPDCVWYQTDADSESRPCQPRQRQQQQQQQQESSVTAEPSLSTSSTRMKSGGGIAVAGHVLAILMITALA